MTLDPKPILTTRLSSTGPGITSSVIIPDQAAFSISPSIVRDSDYYSIMSTVTSEFTKSGKKEVKMFNVLTPLKTEDPPWM